MLSPCATISKILLFLFDSSSSRKMADNEAYLKQPELHAVFKCKRTVWSYSVLFHCCQHKEKIPCIFLLEFENKKINFSREMVLFG